MRDRLIIPFDLPGPVAFALGLAILGAAYVRGYSGFGFSAISLAFAALITNPLPLIPVIFGCELLMTVFQARGIRGHVDWRRVMALLAGAALVLPVAVWVILSLGEGAVRMTVSLIVLVMALVLASGWTLQRQIGTPGNIGIGMVSGVCNAAGVGGLPVAAAMAAQPIAASVFRATMIVYLTGLDLLTLPLLWAGGLVTWDTAVGLVLAVPLLWLGIWQGSRRFQGTAPATFRKFAIYLLLTPAALGLLRAAL